MGEEKDSPSVEVDEVMLNIQTQKGKRGGRMSQSNPKKEKTCNHCKKKGHVKAKCWKKHPELIPEKVKVARQQERSSWTRRLQRVPFHD